MPACNATPAAISAPPRYHAIRKRVHLICFLLFLALPFFDVMRFDIPRQRFYFAGQELWINEFAIIFFSLMFLMFVVVLSSVVYGRVYCGYLCPQMIFSESSVLIEDWLRRKVNKHLSGLSPKARKRLWRALFYLVLADISVFLAFVFISYFVPPRDLFARLTSFDLHTAGGIAGASVTLLTFLDFTLVRQRFCTSVCPYGYLQGMLGDDSTLLVVYRDPGRECIECKKCVRVCEMGIDIRNSPYQIECVHCGECIDACVDVMQRLGKQGLIHYTWGQRWNAKRVLVLLVLAFYACGLFVALGMRRSVLVQLQPDRMTLYRVDAGAVYNRFRLKIANRSRTADTVRIWAEGLPGATLTLLQNPLPLRAGDTREVLFEVSAQPFAGAQEVNHFRIVAQAARANERTTFEETFLMPHSVAHALWRPLDTSDWRTPVKTSLAAETIAQARWTKVRWQAKPPAPHSRERN